MNNTYWGILWKHLRSIPGFAVGVVIALSSIPIKILGISDDFELLVCLPIIGVLVLLLFTFFLAYSDLYNRKISVLPRVLRSFKSAYEYMDVQILLLLEPSELFSSEMYVSVFYIDEDFEKLIGIGTILNIQKDGKIQVIIEMTNKEYDEIKGRLENNDVYILQNLLVKPSIPKTHFSIRLARG